ncbi:hypothetical protein SASPL_119829 [Salvia splendens]|uniref:SAUR family protein n=1 Tax=Salvia splendens TaxID=180675 RepID=A0A8X8XNI5_SALSN|nr:auxin-responsive protein SAUR50-like [Salvia splendens]KAG6417645.1 hypothetical protein SASPL_119829 [Salvia splendens]
MPNTRKKIVEVLNLKRLQKSLLSGKKEMRVPDDVKEGHFAVVAVDERIIVPLSFLTHPSFLRLLEQAAEEYGFHHRGALNLPCRPNELHRILADETPSN